MTFTVSITQPTYLPWLGYFNLIAEADAFVFLDTVQFEKRSWQSRNRIRTKKGIVNWLSVPIKNHARNTQIKNIKIANNNHVWKKKHSLTLERNLRKAFFFKEAEELYKIVLNENTYEFLADMNIEFITSLAKLFKLNTKFYRCSDLSVSGNQADLLLDICEKLKATHFYCNSGSSIYLESSRTNFKNNGIEIVYQNWSHPEYNQTGSDFISHLSCIDAIACMGITKSAEQL